MFLDEVTFIRRSVEFVRKKSEYAKMHCTSSFKTVYFELK